ncbi:MAG: hypothetical protein FWG91_09065 [Lachnospiraceae bacterium]|nr:hypothetical protein [Lachnospiraceae bacterium]
MKLEKGDILVFETGEGWISKAIALLTDSDVSHAAMMYDEENLVEMGLSGIGVNKVTVVNEGRRTTVMRLNPQRSPEPLVKAADVYIDADTAYNIPALVMIGGIVIYRAIRPTPEFVHVVDLVIRAACVAVNALIEKIRKTGKTMTCSQLAYQIYFDCGKDYYLKLIDPLVKRSAKLSDGTVCLFDLAGEAELTGAEFDSGLEAVYEDEEELARLLCAAIEKEAGLVTLASQESIGQTAKSARKLLELLEELLKQCDSKLPLNALFVAPSDLLHAENLLEAGIVKTKVK